MFDLGRARKASRKSTESESLDNAKVAQPAGEEATGIGAGMAVLANLFGFRRATAAERAADSTEINEEITAVRDAKTSATDATPDLVHDRDAAPTPTGIWRTSSEAETHEALGSAERDARAGVVRQDVDLSQPVVTSADVDVLTLSSAQRMHFEAAAPLTGHTDTPVPASAPTAVTLAMGGTVRETVGDGGTIASAYDPSGSVVGVLETKDATGDTHTYTLVSDPSGKFEIVGNEVRVKPGQTIDYETEQGFDLTIRTTDSTGLSHEEVVTLSVADFEGFATAGDEGASLTGTSEEDRLTGGAGGDTLAGGSGDDLLFGLDGADHVSGDAGDDVLGGGDGDDHLRGGAGDDVLDGGAGTDVAVYDGEISDYALQYNSVSGEFTVTDLRVADGDEGSDIVRNVEVFRFAGDAFTPDEIRAYIDGSAPSAIRLEGGTVGETVADGGTIDAAFDPAGTVVGVLATEDASAGDTHTYTLLSDPSGKFELVGNEIRVRAGATIDFETDDSFWLTVRTTDINGQTDDQTLSVSVADYEGQYAAGPLGETIIGTSEEDWIAGGAGADRIDAGAGANVVSGGGGDDRITGAGSLAGDAGNDRLTAVDGTTDLSGGTGDDRLDIATDGALSVDGGEGQDTLSLAGGDGTDVQLTGDGVGRFGGEGVFSEIEAIEGTAGADRIDARADGAGLLLGGGAGDDVILVGSGDDVVDGGTGDDRVVFSGSRSDYQIAAAPDGSGVTVTDLRPGAPDGTDLLIAVEHLTFADGAFRIVARLDGAADAALAPTDAQEIYVGSSGSEYLDFSGSETGVRVDFSQDVPGSGGAAEGDVSAGGIERVEGSGHDDRLIAGQGVTYLGGGAGDDILEGAATDDTFVGGAGDDAILGGAGVDTAEWEGPLAEFAVEYDLPSDTFTITMLDASDEGGGTDTVTGVEIFVFDGVSYTAAEMVSEAARQASNAPTALSLATGGSVDETVADGGSIGIAYDPSGQVVGTLQTVDLDLGDSHVYTLLSDVSGKFEIVGSEIRVRAGQTIDHETDASFELTIRVTDVSGNTLDKVLTIAVADYEGAGAVGPGAAALTGTSEEDTITAARGAGHSTVDGGAGEDTLVVEGSARQIDLSADGALRIDFDAVDGSGDVLSATDVETVVFDDATWMVSAIESGTGGGDTLAGSASGDVIAGNGGDDDVAGGDGADFLFGGAGADTLLGGTGDDYLQGGDGADALTGGTGDDVLDGGDGVDRAIWDGPLSDFSIAYDGASGIYTVIDMTAAGGNEGTDIVRNVETFRFAGTDYSEAEIQAYIADTAPTAITFASGGSIGETVVDGGTIGLAYDPSGANVATLQVSDADANDVHTYTLVSDPSGLFEIVGNEVRVRAGASIDFETDPSVDLTVRVTDISGNTHDEILTISIQDYEGSYASGATGETITGTSEEDTITGGDGDDDIGGGSGDDTLSGGAGHDTITLGAGDEAVDGGNGTDRAVFAGDLQDFSVSYDAGSDTFTITDLNPADGDQGTDTVTGVEIFTFNGVDYSVAQMLAYADGSAPTAITMTGGTVSESVADSGTIGIAYDPSGAVVATLGVLDASGPDDVHTFTLVSDPSGTFEIVGNEVRVRSGQTIDFETDETFDLTVRVTDISGGQHDEVLTISVQDYEGSYAASAGGETVTGTSEEDTITGGAGQDVLAGGAGDDLIEGAGDDDELSAGEGDDVLRGGAGDDELMAGTGTDTLDGGTGDDRIEVDVGDGTVTVIGGDDHDLLDFEQGGGPGGFTATFTGDGAGTFSADAGPASGSFSEIEELEGSSGDDTFDASLDTVGLELDGNGGDDHITGGSGDDTILVDGGDDIAFGGAGDDTLFAGSGTDHLHGGAGDDFFDVDMDDGTTTIFGGDDHDIVDFDADGGSGVTVTFTGRGAATFAALSNTSSGSFVEIEEVDGTDEDDTINAGADDGGLTVFLRDGDDVFTGGSGDDYIDAGDGDDVVEGGAGDDDIEGDDGDDRAIWAGDLSDFDISFGGGIFTITDTDTADGLDEGTDRVWEVETFTFAGTDYTEAQILAYAADTAPTLITLASGGTVDETVADGGTIGVAFDPSGATVATLATADADADDIHTYTLISDPSGTFEIVGNEVRVRSGQTIDYETDTSFDLTVRVTDISGNTHDEILTINVQDYEGSYAAGAGGETVTGTSEEDTITGGAGDDDLSGGDGDDVLDDGGSGNNTLSGGDGDDRLRVHGTSDTTHVDGGAGQDSLDISSGGYTLTFLSNGAGTFASTTWTVTGTFVGIEEINATIQDDVIDASVTTDGVTVRDWGGNDVLIGGLGDDYLQSGDGDDTLRGNAGDDTLDGRGDTDTAIWAGDITDFTISFNGTSYTITDTDVADGLDEGTDTVSDVEIFRFNGVDFTAATIDAFVDGSAPTAITMTGGTVGETVADGGSIDVTYDPSGTSVATLSTTDASGAGDIHSYALVSDPSGKFEIIGNEVRVRAGQSIDFETDPSFDITVRTTDINGTSHDEILTINVVDYEGSATAGDGGETVTGTSEEDVLTGGEGADTLIGGAGDDTLLGGAGTSSFDGGSQEVIVNTTTALDQQDPSVTSLADGGFVIVWESDGQDGDGLGIYAQRYAADGSPVGGEVLVNTTTAEGQGNPSVASLTDGGFVVTWESELQDGDGNGVYLQRFDSAGDPVGVETQVNTTTTYDQNDARVTGLDDGGFVVAWEATGLDGSGTAIALQRYDAAGSPVGGESQVNTSVTGAQEDLKVTALDDGGFVVVWESPNGSTDDIFMQRFAADGTALGGEVLLNSRTKHTQSDPDIVQLDNGRLIVTWEGWGHDGHQMGVFLRVLETDGTPVTSDRVVNETTVGFQVDPTITKTASGGFAIGWTSVGVDGSGDAAMFRLFEDDGTAITGELQLNEFESGNQADLDLTTLDDGRLVAVWKSVGADGSGNAVSAEIIDTDETSMTGGAGDDALVGGAGIETAVWAGDLADFTITYDGATDTFTVTDTNAGDGLDEGTDTVTGVEFFSFNGAVYTKSEILALAADTAPTAITITSGGTLSESVTDGGTIGVALDPAGTVAARLATSDADVADIHTYTIVSDPSGKFEIVGNTIRVAAGQTIDYETDQSFDITVRTTDLSGNSHDEVLTINVQDYEGSYTAGAGGETVTGSSEEDTLTGGTGDDTLSGGDGDDRLEGGAGSDDLYGGGGDDTAVFADALFSDVVFWLNGDGSLQVSSFATNTTDTVWDVETLEFQDVSVPYADILFGTGSVTGTGLGDIIVGSIGADTISAGGGSDHVSGMSGDDIITLGAGSDTAYGASGADTISGDEGDDVIRGGSGADEIAGGAGNDTLFGASGSGASGDTDVAIWSGELTDFTVTHDGSSYTVTDTDTADGLDEGTDSVAEFAVFRFGGADYTEAQIQAYIADDAPTAISIASGGTVNETVSDGGSIASAFDPSGATVATLATTDPNGDDVHSYTILSDPSGKFEIVGNEVRVRASQEIDFETDPSFDITVRTTDISGNTHDETLTITVVDYEGANTSGAGGGSVTGTSEEDALTGGIGDDVIDGGAGDDQINSGAGGNNTLLGGDGDDTITIDPNSGVSHVDGGTGTNTLSVHGNAFTVVFNDNGEGTFTADSGTATGTFENIAEVRGTNSSNNFDASATTDGVTLYSWGADDILIGGAGDDFLSSNDDDDTLRGGAGDDTLRGGADTDTAVWFGDISDFTISFDGTDYTITDTVTGDGLDEGSDAVRDVEIFRFNGVDYTTDNLDAFIDGSAPTLITIASGGTVAETVADGGTIGLAYDPSGSTVATLATTDASSNDIHAYTLISDPSGTFEIVGNEVRVRSGQEIDFETDPSFDITVRTTDINGTSHDEILTINVVDYEGSYTAGNTGETITGTSEEDTVTGGSGNDTLIGSGGTDVLDGGAGDDDFELDTGDGTVSVIGGTGHDEIDFAGSGSVTVTFSGDDAGTISSDDNLSGSFSGIAEINGGGGDDTINASVATTRVEFEGGGGSDVLTGGSGDDRILGNGGDDQIFGGAGADFLEGNTGRDELWGGAGDDHLDGRLGEDTLSGGAGDDDVDGGEDTDRAVWSGDISDFEISHDGVSDEFTIRDLNAGDGLDEGTDTVREVEEFEFNGVLYTYAEMVARANNTAPDAPALSSGGSVVENSLAGTVVGTFPATDADGETIVYTLTDAAGTPVSDPNFEVIGNELRVKSGADIDFEAATTLTVYVTASDLYETTAPEAISVSVDDVAETLSVSGNFIDNSVAETSVTGSSGIDNIVVHASGGVADGGGGDDQVSGQMGDDTLAGGAGNDIVDGDGGNDRAVWMGDLTDFTIGYDGATGTYTITDTDTGDGLDEGADTVRGIETFTFNGTDYTAAQIQAYADGSAPTAVSFVSGGSVGETVVDGGTIGLAFDPSGATVATLATTDASGADDIHTYTLVLDTSGKFELVGNEVRVRSGQTIDFETDTSFDITVRTTDINGNSHDQILTITVQDYEGSYTAGNGGETITGTSEEDLITGGSGADTLIGSDGTDVLDGGSGQDDFVLDTSNGTVTIIGGANWDEIDIDGAHDVTAVFMGDDFGTFVSTGTLNGTFTSVREFDSGAGDDTIDGRLSTQELNLGGGDGNDIVYGGSWGDILNGFGGSDQLFGGAGADLLEGGGDDDILDGGTGDDNIAGEGGDDDIRGGEGDDTLRGNGNDDTIEGGEGDDTVVGGNGADIAVWSGDLADFTISVTDDEFTITDTNTADGLDEGTDTVRTIEVFRFNGVEYTAEDLQAPTEVTIASGGSVNESVTDGGTIDTAYDPSGTTVATLATADANTDDTHTYTLVSDPSGKFEIVGNEVRVLSGQTVDFETDESFDITVRTEDSTGATHDQVLTINVIDYEGSYSAGGGGETVTGTSEEDAITDGSGDDILNGGDGDDVITIDHGNDVAAGDGGDDRFLLHGGAGTVNIDGGTGSDVFDFYGAFGFHAVYSGGGAGTFTSSGTVSGSFTGIERFSSSGNGADIVDATGTSDGLIVWLGAADDTFYGGTGDDTFGIGQGDDHFDGGGGWDFANFGSNTRITDFDISYDIGTDTFTVTDLVGDKGTNTLHDVDAIWFSENGLVYASTLRAYINDAGPTDISIASGGTVNETVVDGGTIGVAYDPSGDTVATLATTDPDGSDDVHTYTLISDPLGKFEIVGNEIRVRSGQTIDFETDESFNLTVEVSDISGNTYSESLTIHVQDAQGSHTAGAGGETVTGMSEEDILTGGAGDDQFFGGAGADELNGGSGNDTLDGGAGNDILVGGLGDDIFRGGAGDDDMDGGTGADTFFVGAVEGNDTITTAADSWTDVIELEGMTSGTAAVAGNTITGNGWTLVLDSGSSVLSQGTDTLDLSNEAAGVITFDDGGSVDFTGIERIAW